MAGDLLVARKDGNTWRLVRVTLGSGGEAALAVLPFHPQEAAASPNGSSVLYVSGGRGLAVVDAESGAVRRISLSALPIRAIDGATWVSNHEIVFGGSRKDYASPETSSLYIADTTTGNVSAFRGLKGGEPSYADDAESLTFVTRRELKRAPYPYRDSFGPWVKETLWLLRSLNARKPKVLTSDVLYIDAGRAFNGSLISPDGRYVLNAITGTDVSVTYQLIEVHFLGHVFLQLSGGSPHAMAWRGSKVAFVQSQLPSYPAKLGLFVYDTSTGALVQYSSSVFGQLDWSPNGDLVGAAWRPGGEVFVSAASNLGAWVSVGAGEVPVWVK